MAAMIDMFLSKRAFGVGIQNATRTILPFHKERRKGDGLLRLQARNSFHEGYGPFSMNHPARRLGFARNTRTQSGDTCAWLCARAKT